MVKHRALVAWVLVVLACSGAGCGGGDADANAELATRTKEQIERMLEEDQRMRFDQLIERMSRRSRR